jgi:hypothetical protein
MRGRRAGRRGGGGGGGAASSKRVRPVLLRRLVVVGLVGRRRHRHQLRRRLLRVLVRRLKGRVRVVVVVRGLLLLRLLEVRVLHLLLLRVHPCRRRRAIVAAVQAAAAAAAVAPVSPSARVARTQLIKPRVRERLPCGQPTGRVERQQARQQVHPQSVAAQSREQVGQVARAPLREVRTPVGEVAHAAPMGPPLAAAAAALAARVASRAAATRAARLLLLELLLLLLLLKVLLLLLPPRVLLMEVAGELQLRLLRLLRLRRGPATTAATPAPAAAIPRAAQVIRRAQGLKDLVQHAHLALRPEERLPVQHLRHDAPDRPHVDRGAVRLGAQQELGSPVPQRHHPVRVRLVRRQEPARQAEVRDLHDAAGAVDQDVLRLEVAVHDAAGVGGVHGAEHLPGERLERAAPCGGGGVGRRAVEQVSEVAVQALEHDVDVGGAEAVDDVLEAV